MVILKNVYDPNKPKVILTKEDIQKSVEYFKRIEINFTNYVLDKEL